jgi:hypothetical protein
MSILSEKDRIKMMVKLTCGLLASGAYTEECERDQSPLKSYELDYDWQEDGYPRRQPFHVLDDAEALLRDIEFLVRQEVENE